MNPYWLILSSAAVAAMVSGLVSLIVSGRNVKLEAITKERAKWRADVRTKSLEVHKAVEARNPAKLWELLLEFRLILNPTDRLDDEILDALHWLRIYAAETRMQEVDREKHSDEARRKFAVCVALLLKFDWERVKRDTKLLPFRGRSAKRLTFDEFMADMLRAGRIY